MALAAPFVVTDPKLTIDGVDYKCATRAVELVPDQIMVNIGGYCAPRATRPGSTKWSCNVELMLGYNDGTDDGTFEELLAIAGTLVTCVVGPSSGAVSASNPSFTFESYIPAIPKLMAELDQSDASIFTLELSPQAEPVMAVA